MELKKATVPATVFAGVAALLGNSYHDQQIREELQKEVERDRTIDVLLIEKLTAGKSADYRRAEFQTYMELENRKADMIIQAEGHPEDVIKRLLKERENGWKE